MRFGLSFADIKNAFCQADRLDRPTGPIYASPCEGLSLRKGSLVELVTLSSHRFVTQTFETLRMLLPQKVMGGVSMVNGQQHEFGVFWRLDVHTNRLRLVPNNCKQLHTLACSYIHLHTLGSTYICTQLHTVRYSVVQFHEKLRTVTYTYIEIQYIQLHSYISPCMFTHRIQ